MNKNCLITFDSVHIAMEMEEILKENGINLRTIPTPREVSHSCGLSILSDYDNLDKILEIIKMEELDYKKIFMFIKNEGSENKVEEII